MKRFENQEGPQDGPDEVTSSPNGTSNIVHPEEIGYPRSTESGGEESLRGRHLLVGSETPASSVHAASVSSVKSKNEGAFLAKMGRKRMDEAQLDRHAHLRILDRELIRAVPARLVIRSGSILASNVGGDDMFNKSSPTTSFHAFLSHTWLTPGWLKRLGLAYYLNVRRAAIASILTLGLLHTLEWQGTLNIPSFSGSAAYGDRVLSIKGSFFPIAALAVFWLVLRFGQEFPLFETRCFLDKCCIHQTDEEKKRVAIKQLGAYLRWSENLVILWQPEYFSRLWCVYELAAFLHINGGSCRRVLIRPLKQSVFAVALCMFHTFATSGAELLLPVLFSSYYAEAVVDLTSDVGAQFAISVAYSMLMGISFYLVLAFFCWMFAKWHMRDREEILKQVRAFRFADAQCHDEEDRSFVAEQISSWFGGLDAFDHYVRSVVASRVELMMATSAAIPYSIALVGSLGHVVLAISLARNAFVDGGVDRLLRVCFSFGSMAFLGDPMAVNLIMRLAATSFGDDAPGKCFFRRRLLGPLATCLIMATCGWFPLSRFPACPLWLSAGLTAVELIAVCLLYEVRPWKTSVDAILQRQGSVVCDGAALEFARGAARAEEAQTEDREAEERSSGPVSEAQPGDRAASEHEAVSSV